MVFSNVLSHQQLASEYPVRVFSDDSLLGHASLELATSGEKKSQFLSMRTKGSHTLYLGGRGTRAGRKET